jgi:hypothetical protein
MGGQRGHYLDGIRLRFGGVENLAEVVEFFTNKPLEKSELGWLKYDQAYRSKIGDLHFKLSFEREDAVLQWHCSSLTTFGPLPE